MKFPKIRACLGIGFSALLVPAVCWAQYEDATTGPLGTVGTCFGAAWADCDKDGDLDLFFSNGGGASKLLRNEGANGTFTDITTSPLGGAGADIGVAWGDFDDDNDLDLFVANANSSSRLLRNDAWVFVPVDPGDAGGSGAAQAAAWADYDLDGDIDLFVTYWNLPNKLYRNDAGILHNATPGLLAVNSWSTGAAWGDFDKDLDPDLYVGGTVQGRLYRNDGAGTFDELTSPSLAKTGVNGVCWGDYDNDDDLDLYLARGVVSSRLLRNDSTPGAVSFTDMFIPAVRDPGNGMGAAWLDYDIDGDLDIFLAKAGADNTQTSPNRLMRNNGNGSFDDVSAGPVLASANSRGVSAGDYDNDGYPDIYVANWGSANQLLHATGVSQGWIQVRLRGTQSNSYGLGARVRIKTGATHQMREISGGSGLFGQDPPMAAFGLTYLVSVVDSIRVYWPSGIVTDSVNVAANQLITLRESGQVGVPDGGGPGVARLLAAYPNPFRSSTTISYDLTAPSPVRLFVVDPSGRLLRVLETSDRKEPGNHIVRWDGRTEDGREAAQGVYYYSLAAGGFRRSLPIILVR